MWSLGFRLKSGGPNPIPSPLPLSHYMPPSCHCPFSPALIPIPLPFLTGLGSITSEIFKVIGARK